MQRKIRATLSLLVMTAALAACGQGPTSASPTAQPSEESFKDFGSYELHYNALRTDLLTAEVAHAFNIQRSKNQVLLNVSMLHKEADHAPRKPVDAEVSVDAYNLNGQLKNLDMRRVTEGEAIYYIGEVSIAGNEILVFDIKAKPANEPVPFEVKFKREFFSD
jgi:hypothetical protein